jgi:uncharacterized protein
MSRAPGAGRWLPWTLAGLAAGVLVLSTATLRVLVGEGEVRFTDVPQVTYSLTASSRPEAVEPESVATAAGDPALIEDGRFGPLPRIGADGRRPLVAYGRPFDLEQDRPMIAVLVLGLGLQAEVTESALALPRPFGLQFSPYAPNLPGLVARARAGGHEVLLDLPMEPPDFPASDPGPHTLLADLSRTENAQRLSWLLARATGYVGLAGRGGRFAESEQAGPVLEELAARGLGLVEIGSARLAAAAAALALPYAGAGPPIDDEPSAMAIDYGLAGLEAEALATGSALGVAQAYPLSLERLRLWASTLDGKGLVLAPVSALLIERSGLTAAQSRS